MLDNKRRSVTLSPKRAEQKRQHKNGYCVIPFIRNSGTGKSDLAYIETVPWS